MPGKDGQEGRGGHRVGKGILVRAMRGVRATGQIKEAPWCSLHCLESPDEGGKGSTHTDTSSDGVF